MKIAYPKITCLDVEGFRSLKHVKWQPGALNVIIGPNGSGKSNLLRVLELLTVSAKGQLGKFIQSSGGMEPLVWDGMAESIKVSLHTEPVAESKGPDFYELELARLGGSSSYRIAHEILQNQQKYKQRTEKHPFKFLERKARSAVIFNEKEKRLATPDEFVNDEESLLSIAAGPFTQNRFIPLFQKGLAAIAVYRNIDTHPDSPIRQPVIARMENQVAPDGLNLVSVLHTLYTGDRQFKSDVNGAMQAAFGDDFEELNFPPAADQRVQLRIRWKSVRREQSAAELSDGTLRFLYLLAILASPFSAPVIAIDEPEIGLHPSMMPIIAEYAIEASHQSQIIFATHSPQLLNAFGAVRPVTTIARWEDGETHLNTVDDAALAYW